MNPTVLTFPEFSIRFLSVKRRTKCKNHEKVLLESLELLIKPFFQAVMNRIHTISVPYAVMKACPLSWVQRVHIHKGKRSRIT